MDVVGFLEARLTEEFAVDDKRSEALLKASIIAELKDGNLRLFPGLWKAVELLAVSYADHPDYREEWRP